ncbi:MAG TPA: P-loop NTPase [Acidobacteriota bacterium]|nr:P-loop NTPase [Acidobacteriota bacterium]
MNEDVVKKPTLVAVGGGKGGVGKSVFSILLGQWLARLGKRCVIVDLDLSCANVHTLLGIKDPSMTVKDLISKRVSSLEEVALSTSTENLRVICGASEVLSVANPVFVQKVKMVRSLSSLEADFVILDLGAGTSFNTLDFFLAAERQIVLTTAEPTAIHNAYVFLRNSVFRRLSQLSRRNETLRKLVNQTMNPENSLKLRSVKDLLEVISDLGGEQLAAPIRSELARIWPGVVVNKVRAVRELSTASVIRHVAHKYLLLDVVELGGVAYDRQVERMVSEMEPLTNCREGGAYESVFEIASKLTAEVSSPRTADVEHSQIGLAS